MAGLFGSSTVKALPAGTPASPGFWTVLDGVLGGKTVSDSIYEAKARQLALDQARQQGDMRTGIIRSLFGDLPAASPAQSSPADASYDTDGMPMAAPVMAPTPSAAPAKPRSLQDVLKVLGPAAMSGLPGAKDVLSMFKDAQPDIDVVNGVTYDKHNTPAGMKIGVNGANINGFAVDLQDPHTIGQYFGQPPAPGAEPTFDRQGHQIGWQLANGSYQAIQSAAGADASGKAAGTAAYSLDTVPGPDGRPITGRRLDLLRTPILGQSEAEKAAATDTAKFGAERANIAPQQKAAVEQQARTTDVVLRNLDQALGSKDGKAPGMINSQTAGMGALGAGIPGLKSHDLKAVLDTIRANVGFDQLNDMRKNSPTGGALGSVSEQENLLLQSVLGSLDQGQSPEQLRAKLADLRTSLVAARDARAKVFNQIYATPSPAAAPSARPVSGAGYSVVGVRRGGQ